MHDCGAIAGPQRDFRYGVRCGRSTMSTRAYGGGVRDRPRDAVGHIVRLNHLGPIEPDEPIVCRCVDESGCDGNDLDESSRTSSKSASENRSSAALEAPYAAWPPIAASRRSRRCSPPRHRCVKERERRRAHSRNGARMVGMQRCGRARLASCRQRWCGRRGTPCLPASRCGERCEAPPTMRSGAPGLARPQRSSAFASSRLGVASGPRNRCGGRLPRATSTIFAPSPATERRTGGVACRLACGRSLWRLFRQDAAWEPPCDRIVVVSDRMRTPAVAT